jgi:hypothetical protein
MWLPACGKNLVGGLLRLQPPEAVLLMIYHIKIKTLGQMTWTVQTE